MSKIGKKRQLVTETESVDNDPEVSVSKSTKKKLLLEEQAAVEDDEGDEDVDNDMQKLLATFGGKT